MHIWSLGRFASKLAKVDYRLDRTATVSAVIAPAILAMNALAQGLTYESVVKSAIELVFAYLLIDATSQGFARKNVLVGGHFKTDIFHKL